MSVAMGQRKKRVDPFAIFFKAGRPGAGVRKTDDVRPAGGIRQKNTAAGRGKPREGQRKTTEETGIGTDSIEEGKQSREREKEESEEAGKGKGACDGED